MRLLGCRLIACSRTEQTAHVGKKMPNNENPVSKEFPKLFHYTSVSAFKNIYKENKFRATYHEDLNDKSEFRRFRLNVCEFVKPEILKIFDQRMQSDPAFASIIKRDDIEVVKSETSFLA